jgi:hypothetical protein
MSDGEETISKAEHLRRLAQKQDRIKDLETQLASADTAKLESELKKATRRAERFEADVERITGEFSEFRSLTERTQTLTGAGITDPDEQDLVLYRYGRLEADGRPVLADYLAKDGAGRSDAILSRLTWAGAPETRRVTANGAITRSSPAAGTGDRLAVFMAKPASYRVSEEGREEWAAINDS